MAKVFYNLFLLLYSAGIRIAALLKNDKAKKRLHGIKQPLPTFSEKTIWMHCASLGEFEQGRPLLEKIRKIHPSYKIVLSFFSSSGYEMRKNFSGADIVVYLPEDSKRNAEEFLNSINPAIVFWVKYEYWYYFLKTINKRKIPLYLVSAMFRPDQPFFKWYGGLYREMLKFFTLIFVQTQESKELISSFTDKVIVAGDTRLDRVLELPLAAADFPILEEFTHNQQTLIAGSTWVEDDAVLAHYVNQNPDKKFIIAPHEIFPANLQNMLRYYHSAEFYSALKGPPKSNVIILDTIGMLNKIYRYATVVYIGGGFNDSGIHNLAEAAVYNKPVVFGPVYEKFPEATALILNGGAASIRNAPELEKELNKLFNDDTNLKHASFKAGEYIKTHAGATDIIMNNIELRQIN
ncbi:MAG: 3-deoxy-D-manno-octulosonic acid transferase [Bacteroidetes bacterium]|nr:3-deoxy-D-manno-octulosonic acid transferase [Bacteroidota bacterium]